MKTLPNTLDGRLAQTALACMVLFLVPPAAAELRSQEPETASVRVYSAVEAEEDGWLGFSYGLDVDGVVIERVIPGSPADEAGLARHDLLLRINGREATMRYLGELSSGLEPGDTVRLRVRRDGNERELTIVAAEDQSPFFVYSSTEGGPFVIHFDSLQDRVRVLLDSAMVELDSIDIPEITVEGPDSTVTFRFGDHGFPGDGSLDSLLDDMEFELDDVTISAWPILGAHGVAGAEFEELNPDLAEYFGTEEGVLVVNVSDGTPAARAGLQPGDVVVYAAGEPVRSLDDLRAALAGADEDEPLRIRIIRHGEGRTLELEHD